MNRRVSLLAILRAGVIYKKTAVLYFSLYLTFSPLFASPAFARITTADRNTTFGPNSGASNVPVLNISAPTAGGVSHNRFNEFNVDGRGLIVNNLALQNYSTQWQSVISGAHVEFNPNLGTGEAARIIINEVISNSTTALRGWTEIYGSQADYIIANPNGITCIGCGFINTGRLSLITGALEDGSFENFNIGAGTLSIEQHGGIGLRATSHADLVSNAVRIAGEIQVAGNLGIFSGNERFDSANRTITSDDVVRAPQIAVDASALGAMRANSIHVIATQKGFGVNLSGNLVADMSAIEITADGNIAFRNAQAAERISVTSVSGDVGLMEGMVSSECLAFDAGRDFENRAEVITNTQLAINAGRDFINRGEISSFEAIDIAAGRDFTNLGDMVTSSNLQVFATRNLSVTDGSLMSGGYLRLTSGGDFFNSTEIASNNSLDITAGGDFTNSGDISSVEWFIINTLGTFENRSSGELLSGSDMKIDAAGNFTNTGEISTGGNLALSSFIGNFLNSGNIGAEQNINISTYGSFNNTNTGEIFANEGLNIASGSDFINRGSVLSGADMSIIAGSDFVNYYQIIAEGDMDFSAGRDFVNRGDIIGNGGAFITSLRNFTNFGKISTHDDLAFDIRGSFSNTANGELLSGQDLTIRNTTSFVNSGDIQTRRDLSIQTSGNATNNSDANIISGRDMSIVAGGNFLQAIRAYILSGRNLNMEAGNRLENRSHIDVMGNAAFRARDVHNFGRLLANGNMEFRVYNDLINYERAGIFSGGSIGFFIGRNLINAYRAEIFASRNLVFEGYNGRTSTGGRLTVDNSYRQRYFNPHLNNAAPTPPSQPPITPPVDIPTTGETYEQMDIIFRLDDGTEVVLPADKLPEGAPFGTEFETECGHTFIQGVRIHDGNEEVPNPDFDMDCISDCVPETIIVPRYRWEEGLTIQDSSGNSLNFTICTDCGLGDDDPWDDIFPPNNLPVTNRPTLGTGNDNVSGVTFATSRMANLINFAGRIHADGNISIGAHYLQNVAYNYIPAGQSLFQTDWRIVREGRPCSTTCDWRLMAYQVIRPGSSMLRGDRATITAGGDILITGRSVLNQSSTIAAGDNVAISLTGALQNLTYTRDVTLLVREQRRRTRGVSGFVTYTQYLTSYDYVESSADSRISAGRSVNIRAQGVNNGQRGTPIQGLGPDASRRPTDDLGARLQVNINLPQGNNGMFVVVNNGPYLVVSNVPFLNPNDFVGGNFLLNLLATANNNGNGNGNGSSEAITSTDPIRFLGDPAYETHLIMNAIMQATGRQFLQNDGNIGSPLDQMTLLYNNAAHTAGELGLVIGQTLTQTQIDALQRDIIWYVRREIDGHVVLVPELFLSQATLASINGNGDSGSTITGFSVGIEADWVANFGEISADSLLSIDTAHLRNESNAGSVARITSGGIVDINAGIVENLSAEITGQFVQITADELINLTKVYGRTERTAGGGLTSSWTETRHIEEAGHTALIGGTGGVSLNVAGLLHNSGADIRSDENIVISAGHVLLDTIRLNNSHESSGRGSMSLSGSRQTSATSSGTSTNIVSEIAAGGGFSLTTTGDARFVGTNINTGGDIDMTIGGDLSLLAARDYSYSQTTGSRSRGLNPLGNVRGGETFEYSITNQGVNINSGGSFSANASNNINIVGANITTAGDATLIAGNDVNIFSSINEYGSNSSASSSRIDRNVISGEESLSLRHNLTEMNLGGNLNITSGNNVNMVGVTVDAADGTIYAGNQFRVLSVQDYDSQSSYHMRTGVAWDRVLTQSAGSAALAAAGTIVPNPYSGALMSGAATGGIRAGEMLTRSNWEINANETEMETITQRGSELNFSGTFRSYSENNTIISSSTITARDPNSSMETGQEGRVIIADLYDTKTITQTRGRYSPEIGLSVSLVTDSTTQANNNETDFPLPPTTGDRETYFGHFVEDTPSIIDTWGQGISNAVGGPIGDVIKDNVTGDRIRQLAIGQLRQIAEQLENSTNQQPPLYPPEPSPPNAPQGGSDRVNQFCGGRCNIQYSPPVIIQNNRVESVIRFGE